MFYTANTPTPNPHPDLYTFYMFYTANTPTPIPHPDLYTFYMFYTAKSQHGKIKPRALP